MQKAPSKPQSELRPDNNPPHLTSYHRRGAEHSEQPNRRAYVKQNSVLTASRPAAASLRSLVEGGSTS